MQTRKAWRQRVMAPVHYHNGKFPPTNQLDWEKLVPLIGPASAAIARYDGMLAAIPNPEILLSPLSTQEAVLSSKIEGTQTTVEEILEFEAGKKPDTPARLEDFNEVINYRNAIAHAEEMLKTLPLSGRVIRSTHSVLLSGVRGQGRAPGEYRKTPNWIGPPGCDIENARFVPVGADELPDAMSSWERFLHAESPDLLIQLAVLHAEFEALHPFLDGNGRLGRMLIPLFLWQNSLIREPTFYISAYFDANREAYYEKLLAVSRDDDWTDWCRFFLEAVKAQAEINLEKTQSILTLYEDMKERIVDMTRSQYAMHTLDWLFERPVFRASHFVKKAGIPQATSRRLLGVLQKNEVLKVILQGKGQQSTLFAYIDLLKIAG